MISKLNDNEKYFEESEGLLVSMWLLAVFR